MYLQLYTLLSMYTEKLKLWQNLVYTYLKFTQIIKFLVYFCEYIFFLQQASIQLWNSFTQTAVNLTSHNIMLYMNVTNAHTKYIKTTFQWGRRISYYNNYNNWTRDREVAGSTPGRSTCNDSGQVVHTHVPLSQSSVICYWWPKSGKACRLEGKRSAEISGSLSMASNCFQHCESPPFPSRHLSFPPIPLPSLPSFCPSP